MTSMVYVDPDFGPSATELFAAAQIADGRPGQFLAALGAEASEAGAGSSACTVHETPASYVVPSVAQQGVRARSRRRIDSALARAERRAADLAAAGRHAAAIRLLERAIRLLNARGQGFDAGRCALRLTWIVRSRGGTARALEHAEQARKLGENPALQIAASVAIGILWTDEGRYLESESALRAAVAAAAAIERQDLVCLGSLGLARTLLWQHRTTEALAAIDNARCIPDTPSGEAADVVCEALTLVARIHAANRDVASALSAASRALENTIQDHRVRASAHRAMALALSVAGDAAGAVMHVRSGLRAAATAHLPLTALRLRALWLATVAMDSRNAHVARRLRAGLEKAVCKRQLPHVVRTQIEVACRIGPAPQAAVLYPNFETRREPAAAVAELVDAAQRASDDSKALGRVLDVLGEQLQTSASLIVAGGTTCRVLAASGRVWRERPSSALRALDTGFGVPIDRAVQPPEAAEPVKYAGETVAAIACRWAAGHAVDPAVTAHYLRSAALAVSGHVQALLDVREPPLPGAAWGDLLGDSPAAATLREAVQRAARAPFPVLVEGESGTGKELVARAIHRLGLRRDRRFCAINCAAITDELVEAELFGHARGAFTGAAAERAGLFEEADGGSLFLDEVGELSARAQAKLLRVLQEGEVRRVGENFPRRVDVRLIAATNRRLEQEVGAGRFRADLRFRLDVIRITVPPLRERIGDIPVLATHFWAEASSRVGSRATLGADTLAALSRYDWPGNVRELQNAIAWIAVHAPKRGKVSAAMLPSRLAASAPMATGSFEAAREDFERRFVRAALAQTAGHRGRTAEVLGVSRQGLAKMLRRLRIE